jgi:hypothetical protein
MLTPLDLPLNLGADAVEAAEFATFTGQGARLPHCSAAAFTASRFRREVMAVLFDPLPTLHSRPHWAVHGAGTSNYRLCHAETLSARFRNRCFVRWRKCSQIIRASYAPVTERCWSLVGNSGSVGCTVYHCVASASLAFHRMLHQYRHARSAGGTSSDMNGAQHILVVDDEPDLRKWSRTS